MQKIQKQNAIYAKNIKEKCNICKKYKSKMQYMQKVHKTKCKKCKKYKSKMQNIQKMHKMLNAKIQNMQKV